MAKITVNLERKGPQGEKGNTGVGVLSTVDNGNGTFTINYTDGTSFVTSDLTGPTGAASTVAGPQGPQGPQGEQGASGSQGPAGQVGSTGSQGVQGLKGDKGDKGDTGADSTVAGPQGVVGPQGPQGPQGADSTVAGPTGPQGPQGPQGATGPQGPQGADSTVVGPTGPQGATGPQGPQGDVSNSGITDLSDVDTTTTAPADGQALVWDNAASQWEPGTIEGGVTSIVAGSGIGLSPTNGLGDVTVSANISFEYARVIMGSDVLRNGASQQNFDSETPQRVKFNTSADTEGTNITIDTTNNRITVGATGYYVITSNISFYSGGARTTPATTFKVNGSTDLLGQGYGYIRSTSGQSDNNNLITCIVELQANDYVEVFVGDSSTVSADCYATQGFFEIGSTGGASGATGAQGPSGTTYDVVTLTESTTLSSVHTTKYLVVNSSSLVNITVPASAAYDTYAEFVIEQRGTGAVTVVAASGVTINSSETLVAGGQYAVMGLKRTASNVYTLTGERQAS